MSLYCVLGRDQGGANTLLASAALQTSFEAKVRSGRLSRCWISHCAQLENSESSDSAKILATQYDASLVHRLRALVQRVKTEKVPEDTGELVYENCILYRWCGSSMGNARPSNGVTVAEDSRSPHTGPGENPGPPGPGHADEPW